LGGWLPFPLGGNAKKERMRPETRAKRGKKLKKAIKKYRGYSQNSERKLEFLE
jgi:hypothetical protein